MFKHENTIEDEHKIDEGSDDYVVIGVNGMDLNKIKPFLEKFKKAVGSFEELQSQMQTM